MSAGDLALVVVSALLHATWNAFAKGSRDPVAFNVLLFAPPAIATLALLPFFSLGDIPPAVWGLTLATGVVHALYSLWLGMAYARADLSLVYPISRSAPAFVALAAVPLLNELPTVTAAGGIVVVVFGVWLVHTGGHVRWHAFLGPGAVYAYLALAATVAYSLLDKRIMEILSAGPWSGPAPRAAVFYFLLCSATTPIVLPLAWRRLSPGGLVGVARHEPGRVLGCAAVSFASYGLILQALRTVPVSYVVAVRQVGVLFAVAIGMAWMGERPSGLRLVGAAATVVGIALVAGGG